MNTALMWSTGQDVTETNPVFFGLVAARAGGFVCDVAALASNRKVECYFGPDHEDPARRDCLSVDWPTHGPNWLNPPYSEPEHACKQPYTRCKKKRCVKREFHIDAYRPGCIDFVRKASEQRLRGVETWVLLAARTDNEWFHEFIWDAVRQEPRRGVTPEFLQGRQKFVGEDNSAPFPSMLVIFRPEPL